MGRAALCLLLAAALATTSSSSAEAAPPPTAEDRDAARALANEGLAHFEKGDYERAIEKFRAAEEHVHAPPHVLYLARAHAKLDRLVRAIELYRSVSSETLGAGAPRAFKDAQAQASKELEELERRVPRVAIEVVGAATDTVEVTVDGEPVSSLEMPLDPGEHRIVAEAEGSRRAEAVVTLAAGEGIETVRLELPPIASEPSDEGVPLEPVFVIGAGGAVLIAAGVLGGLALARAGELRDACPSVPCHPANQTLADEANAFATVSTSLFVVGGITAAAGTSWLLYAVFAGDEAGDADEEEVEAMVGPGWLGVRGSF